MAAFSAASSQYFSVLSSIDVRLRRHITALEDADILPSEAVLLNFHTVQSEVDPPQRTSAKSKNTITNGGLGNLDIGWLNSRNNDIEKTMEAELWEQAQGLVQKTLVDKSTSEDDADVPMSNGSGTYTG